MSAILFSIQSLNNIWVMSIRKCSIGVIGSYFFFKPGTVNFPCRSRLAFFFDQYQGIMFFCRVWLMFCMPSKRKHAGVGRNTTSVELERKNLPDLHCKFLRQHRKKKSILYRKKILSASVCKKKLHNFD